MLSEPIVLPKARSVDLVTRPLNDELLVYDRTSNKAHCLNPTAALVWQSCDGASSASDIAARMSGEDCAVSEQVVWLALSRLQKLDLLEAPVVPGAMMAQLGRRDAVRMLGLASLIAIPAITSVMAPTPAQAASGCPSNECGGGPT